MTTSKRPAAALDKFPVRAALAEAIREVRNKKRISQITLAMKSGLSLSAIREVEDKLRPVTFREMKRFERGLGRDGAKLLRRAVMRRVRRDPKLRAFAIETLSMVLTNAEKALHTGDEDAGNSSTRTLQ